MRVEIPVVLRELPTLTPDLHFYVRGGLVTARLRNMLQRISGWAWESSSKDERKVQGNREGARHLQGLQSTEDAVAVLQ